jgi:cytosine/adenosine deaminase-related metal-dependent hydrolase
MLKPIRILSTSWVLPVGAPPIRDGAVGVRDGRVTWVGKRSEVASTPVEDLGPGVLMPGLVNAHCHLELSHLRGACTGAQGFVPWVRELVEARGRDVPAKTKKATEEAVRWLEKETATVAVGDVSNTLESVAALSASPLRAVVFHELIGWDPQRAEAIVSEAEGNAARARDGFDNNHVTVRLAAHAPHSVSPALFASLRRRGGPAAVHLAESPAETSFLRDGGGEWAEFLRARGLGGVAFQPPGVSPVQYLDRLGLLHGGLLAAHAVHVDDEDVKLLGRRGVSVVACPSSNKNLRVGVAPLAKLVAAGVRVCLGTDSLASGDSLDVAHEMTLVHRSFPDLPLGQVIRMATMAGASVLGFPDLGTLARGKAATFAFAKADKAPADPEAFVVGGAAALRRLVA